VYSQAVKGLVIRLLWHLAWMTGCLATVAVTYPEGYVFVLAAGAVLTVGVISSQYVRTRDSANQEVWSRTASVVPYQQFATSQRRAPRPFSLSLRPFGADGTVLLGTGIGFVASRRSFPVEQVIGDVVRRERGHDVVTVAAPTQKLFPPGLSYVSIETDNWLDEVTLMMKAAELIFFIFPSGEAVRPAVTMELNKLTELGLIARTISCFDSSTGVPVDSARSGVRSVMRITGPPPRPELERTALVVHQRDDGSFCWHYQVAGGFLRIMTVGVYGDCLTHAVRAVPQRQSRLKAMIN
jgi:hypothetical protein